METKKHRFIAAVRHNPSRYNLLSSTQKPTTLKAFIDSISTTEKYMVNRSYVSDETEYLATVSYYSNYVRFYPFDKQNEAWTWMNGDGAVPEILSEEQYDIIDNKVELGPQKDVFVAFRDKETDDDNMIKGRICKRVADHFYIPLCKCPTELEDYINSEKYKSSYSVHEVACLVGEDTTKKWVYEN